MDLVVDLLKREDVVKMAELDRKVFGEDEYIPAKFLLDWYDLNPFQWIAAKDLDDNFLGYMGLFHIDKNAFDKISSGAMTEKGFTKDDFVEFKRGNHVYCYISGFVARNNDSRVAISLINKAIWYFRFLKENGITVEKICTTAITPIGLKLCQKLGFRKTVEGPLLPNGIKPATFVLDFHEENFSRVINAIKEAIIENDEYF